MRKHSWRDGLEALLSRPKVTADPGRYYFVTVCPTNPHVLDEGMDLKILLPAENPRQARRRVRRYAPGRIQAVQLVRWTER